MPANLLEMSCAATPSSTAPLKGAALKPWRDQVPGWTVVDEHHLQRSFPFPDFATALAFVNRVGAIAEREQHHPDILLGWGKAEITTYTHSVQGLSQNDFILAAKISAEAAAHPAANK